MSEETKMMKRSAVPLEDTWNLESLCKDINDFNQKITEIDLLVESFSSSLQKLTKNSLALDNILSLVADYEAIFQKIIIVSYYSSLGQSQDYTDISFSKASSKFSSKMAGWLTDLSDFQEMLYSLSAEQITQLMSMDASRISFYRKLEAEKAYRLSPEVEKVLSSYTPLFRLPEEIYQTLKLADMFFPDFEFAGKTYQMSYVLFENDYQLNSNTEFRRKAFQVFSETLKKYGNTFASIYQAEVSNQVTTAKLRGYKSVFEYLLANQEVSVDMYNKQLDTLVDKLGPVMQRYAKLLQHNYKLPNLTFSDLKLHPLPDSTPKITKKEAEEYCKQALAILGVEYNEVIEEAFSNRWIDWAQNEGKSTGGFCASPYGQQGYILLSWNGLLSEVFTLIHELGHAVHFSLTNKYNKMLNVEPSLYLVEAPSTFNELLLTRHLLKNSNDEKIKAFVVASMLSNTYYHNMVTHLLEAVYQREVYRMAEQGEALDFQTLCELKLASQKRFFADVVDLEYAELTWMRQPHYYSGLYSYTYSSGLNLATYLIKQIDTANGKEFINTWLDLLKSGGTYAPLEFSQKLGLDLTDEASFDKTIEYIDEMVSYLEDYCYKQN